MAAHRGPTVPWFMHGVAVVTSFAVAGTFFGSSLFSFHVALMSLAFLLVIPEGIFLAIKAESVPRADCLDARHRPLDAANEDPLPGRQRATQLANHLYVQASALFLATVGFSSIFISKMQKDKPHFVSWHSWVGAATLALVYVIGLGGVILYQGGLPKPMRKYIGLLRRMHRLCGKMVVHMGIFATFLALCVFEPTHHRHKGLWTYMLGGALAVLEVLLLTMFSEKKRGPPPLKIIEKVATPVKPEANDDRDSSLSTDSSEARRPRIAHLNDDKKDEAALHPPHP